MIVRFVSERRKEGKREEGNRQIPSIPAAGRPPIGTGIVDFHWVIVGGGSSSPRSGRMCRMSVIYFVTSSPAVRTRMSCFYFLLLFALVVVWRHSSLYSTLPAASLLGSLRPRMRSLEGGVVLGAPLLLFLPLPYSPALSSADLFGLGRRYRFFRFVSAAP